MYAPQAKKKSLTVTLLKDGKRQSGFHGESAVGQILELGASLTGLGVKPEDTLQFFVEVFSKGQSVDRTPRETTLTLTVPSPDFEMRMWQV